MRKGTTLPVRIPDRAMAFGRWLQKAIRSRNRVDDDKIVYIIQVSEFSEADRTHSPAGTNSAPVAPILSR